MDKQECIIIFVRSPDKGKVKTRLAAVLDQDTVLELYRRSVLDLLETIRHTGFDLRVCFYPRRAERKLVRWLGEKYIYEAQQGRDLGERMENAFLAVFAGGYARAVIIGSDCPDLPAEILKEAVNSLSVKNAVIGPAKDGGYYLIGFNAGHIRSEIFKGIDWGTATVFEQTMRLLNENGCNVHILPVWRDIDTYQDVVAFIGEHELMPAGSLLTLDYLRACAKSGRTG